MALKLSLAYPGNQSIVTSQKITNQSVANLLEDVAARLQILEANRFRVIAFQNAAESIRSLGQNAGRRLTPKAAGIDSRRGQRHRRRAARIARNRTVAEFDELAEQVPDGVIAMMKVPDMGPKKAKRLWQELDITSIEQLQSGGRGRRACQA